MNSNYRHIALLLTILISSAVFSQQNGDHTPVYEAELQLYLSKPFYFQTWSIYLVAIGLLIGVWLFYRRRTAKLETDRELLEAELKKCTKTIQEQSEKLNELDKAKTHYASNSTHECGPLKGSRHLLIFPNQIPNILEGSIKATEAAATSLFIPLALPTSTLTTLNIHLEEQKKTDNQPPIPSNAEKLILHNNKSITAKQRLQERNQVRFQEPKEKSLQQEEDFILQIQNFILEHLDETDLNGNRIGKEFGISRTHLYRKLKALESKPISELVRDARLEKAKELLLEGKLNVSEVAWQTGFSTINYFSATFKKAYGKTPSQIKKKSAT